MGEEKKKLEQVQKLNDQLETLTKEKSVSEVLVMWLMLMRK
jgi:hypothetical protein